MDAMKKIQKDGRTNKRRSAPESREESFKGKYWSSNQILLRV